MSGPFGASQFMYASGGFYPFEISNSLRFDTASSTYLEKDSYTHNRQTFTYSFWFKPTNTTTRQFIFGRYVDGNNVSALEYDGGSSARLSWYDYQSGAYTFQQRTNALHRDESAWYHVVLRVDTTDSTAGSRARMYVNGTQQTSFSAETVVSQNVSFLLGDGGNDFRWGTEGSNNRLHFGGYLADIIVIDGSSLPPTSFAETKNDIWIPKSDIPGSDSYGTNGYRLQFKQTGTSQNSSGIGADTGGNDVHFSVSALAATDVSVDTPTNNFCLPNPANKTDNIVFSEGNTKAVYSTFSQSPNGTIGARSGKWYYEVKMAGTHARMGFCESHCPQGDADTSTTFPLYAVYSNGSNGLTVFNSVTAKSSTANTGYTSFSGGDTLGLALDIDNGKFYAHLNGTYYNSGDPAGGTGALVTGITAQKGGIFLPYLNCGTDSTKTFEFNFGAPSHAISSGNADENGYGNFEYAVPSGFLSLCTANLPDPVATIDPAKGGSPQDYFSADIFTGNGTNQDIDIGFVPNLVWTKQRTDDSGGLWMDSVRGDDAYLQPSNANDEGNFGNITFTSTGYNVNGNSNLDNEASHNYVGWSWKAGTAFSNDASATSVGTIDSEGSVNTDVGFSIIKYGGSGSNATVAHGLNSAPDVVLVKGRSSDSRFWTYWGTQFDASTTYAYLNTNDGEDTGGASITNSAYPTSSVFSIGTSVFVNGSGETYIAYCFHEVEGYSKFGKYTGNGNDDGPFVHLGFRPAWLAIKKLDESGTSWQQYDTARSSGSNGTQGNFVDNRLILDDVNNEGNGLDKVDILSNGFKLRQNADTTNGDTHKYLYLAFAEQPFKYANAR